MAQKVNVILVDDTDGGEADETVPFSLDGVSYEIDLSKRNADRLREAVAPFVDVARPQSRRGGSRRTSQPAGRNKAVRAWAIAQGLMESSARGRIPRTVVEAYDLAHP